MNFKKWFIAENGVACNLALAYKIDFRKSNGSFEVYAKFPFCTDAAPVIFPSLTLKTFDNADDAQNFILDLVDSLNAEEGVPF